MSTWCQVSNFTPVLLVFSFLLNLTNSEIFTSFYHMQKVLYTEKQIADELRKHVIAEEERLQKLRKIADDFEEHSKSALTDIGKHLGNPVNAYLLVKRFTVDWEKIVDSLVRPNSSDFLTGIQSQGGALPGKDDFDGAATALLRLQDTYQLPTSKIARGNLSKDYDSPQMSAADCFELGKIAYNQGDYYHAILWMEEALNVLDTEVNKTADRVLTLDYLAFSVYKQGNIRHAYVLTNELLALDPSHTRAQSNMKYYEKLLAEEDQAGKRGDNGDMPAMHNPRQLDSYRQGQEFATYEALCRGEEVMPNPYQHQLKCRYVHNNKPGLLLRPVKMEEMYLKPRVVLFHDILSDAEMTVVKQFAGERLKRATARNAATGRYEPAFYRISKSAWLKEDEHPYFKTINDRIGDVSQLNMETAEDLQVANYGIGGHYEPHFDFARSNEKNAFNDEIGNRVATMLFYMSDVEAGGATVFIPLGLKVFPKKGMAVFWHNLLKNGEGDYNTRHAACPVLVGQKWVSNKWIHDRGQEFYRPCGLDPEE